MSVPCIIQWHGARMSNTKQDRQSPECRPIVLSRFGSKTKECKKYQGTNDNEPPTKLHSNNVKIVLRPNHARILADA